jgi:hypothetical protein
MTGERMSGTINDKRKAKITPCPVGATERGQVVNLT